MVYDYAIIGGGVVGSAIFNKLTRLGQKCVLLEKGDDVALGASRANSGIVHSGYDCEENSLKAKLNVLGNKMFPSLCKELSVPFVECGSVVVGNDLEKIEILKKRGQANGVSGLEILNRDRLVKLVPNIADDILYALHAKTAGIVSPWALTIALAEEAVINGGKVMLNFEVNKASFASGIWKIFSNKKNVEAKFVINSSGAGFNEVSKILGAEEKEIFFKSGEYYLLDKIVRNYVNLTVFPLPTEKGKGVLVTPTADGNVLVGPSSIPLNDFSTETTSVGLDYVKNEANKIFKNIPLDKCIRTFAGVRTGCGKDFVVEKSLKAPNVILLAGINSPGLTSAPAIACYVAELLGLHGKEKAMKKRHEIKPIVDMKESELNELIKKNSLYGKIVCRCETVSEGEIVEAIHSPLKPQSVDAIKRRVRAGMGRCQGGFCMAKVMSILSRENHKKFKDICKENTSSKIAGFSIK